MPIERGAGVAVCVQLADELRRKAVTWDASKRFLTEREISQDFGVSRVTACKAMRQLVDEGILYRVQGLGTFRAGGRGSTIGDKTVLAFLPPSIRDLSFPTGYVATDFAQGIVDGVGSRAHLSLVVIPREVDEAKFCASRVSSPFVDALILFAWSNVDALMNTATNLRKPFALLNCKDKSRNSILADEAAGAREATEYLLGLGRRRILFVGRVPLHPEPNHPETTRFLGFKSAMERAGLPLRPEWLVNSPGIALEPEHLAALKAVMSGPAESRPDAIFAASDVMALEVLRTLRAEGIRVPDDVDLIGFDDSPDSARSNPPLTTVHKPRHAMGVRAAQLVLDQLENGFSVGGPEFLPCRLVLRGTCAPAINTQLAPAPV